jgi:hypothetical protein
VVSWWLETIRINAIGHGFNSWGLPALKKPSAGSIPSIFQYYQVGRGFNSKRHQTSAESSTLSESKFEQVGHGFKSEDHHLLSVVTLASILFVNRNVGINLTAFFKMSGREGRNNGRGGCGRGGASRGGRGR